MPPSIIHITMGIVFGLMFVAGNVFPDIDKVFQKGFFENKCYKGFFKDQPHCRFLKRGILHNVWIWAGLMVFSMGCVLHLLSDYYPFI